MYSIVTVVVKVHMKAGSTGVPFFRSASWRSISPNVTTSENVRCSLGNAFCLVAHALWHEVLAESLVWYNGRLHFLT